VASLQTLLPDSRFCYDNDENGSQFALYGGSALLIGPVFTRELAIAPRRVKLYVARTSYALALLVLMSTAWLVLTGTQMVRDVGDLARFGTAVFQILAPLQLALAAFFAALLAASEVAHEKDRRTLILLLLTNLSNAELVLGKLLASLLSVLVGLAAALPVFMLTALLGGVSYGQIARALCVTLATVLCCGSLGSVLALWREKTFQALAMTVLILMLWLAVGELVAAGALGESFPIGFGSAQLSCEALAAGFSPWQAILEAARPYVQAQPALGPLGSPVYLFLTTAGLAAVVLNGVAIMMVRVWNPSREAEERGEGREEREGSLVPSLGVGTDETLLPNSQFRESSDSSLSPLPSALSPARTRRVWDNPIIWREIRTWAYGRKILLVRLAYLVLFALAAGSLYWMVSNGRFTTPLERALGVAPLMLLTLVLVNAQAVTALTSERDVGALDLLLVTDLTPKEIVFGKLGGVFYNTKEMVLLPMLLGIALWWGEAIELENLLYLLGCLAVLYLFAATVGLHAGMTYANSGAAVATSLGTVFFLFVGLAVCMTIMMEFSGSFHAQFLPFFAFMVFGGAGLYAVLGVRNPSTAIGVASFLCPFATFYAITSYLLDAALAVFLVTVAAYGFTTVAMLVPAIYEFDVATGRTTIEE
jgi:ABC-type transport system involved in multi-copper enzyme maturation permease subunit